MKQFLDKNQNWICSVITIAGVAVFNAFDGRYVTKVEFAEYQKSQAIAIERIAQSVIDVKESVALLKEKSNQLADHESRLRIVEKKL